jgi:hypothetical protein
MRIGFEEERRQRKIWWEEMERKRPLSECPEIKPQLVAQMKRRYATDEDAGQSAVGRHIGRIDSDADASGEQRIDGTNRVRFDWMNRDGPSASAIRRAGNLSARRRFGTVRF